MGFVDIVFIIGASLFGNLMAEAISWFLIYRTSSYQRMKADIDRFTKKVEKSKGTIGDKSKAREKKEKRYEERLNEINRDMLLAKFKSVFAIGIAMFLMFRFMRQRFENMVVATLPFEPVSLVRGISHQGLPGEDWTECSMTFIFAIRPSLQKLLGTEAPTTNPSLFGKSS